MNQPIPRVLTQVISLLSASARREQIKRNLDANRSIQWSFFDAATATTPTVLTSDANRQRNRFGRALTAAEIGCFKSHFQVLQRFVDSSSADWVLVVEDDVLLDPLFDFNDAVRLAADRDLGYLRLYAKKMVPFLQVEAIGARQLVRYLTDPYGAQAYLISRPAASRFLATIEGITLPIDDELGRFWKNGLIPYALFPFPVLESAAPSTIEDLRNLENRQRQDYSPARLSFRMLEKLAKTSINLRLKLERR